MEKKMEKQEKKERFFSARRMALMAIFTAMAFIVSMFDFPIFPAAPFLKLDFGNVFIMLVGFLLGPVEGIIVCVIKEVIHIPFGSTGGVGELANIIMTTAYLLLPAFIYRFKKGFKIVVFSLILGVAVMVAAGLLVNRYINFPLFYGESAAETFSSLWIFIIFFNLIKGAAISVFTCLLYKTVSRLYTKFN